MTLFTRDTQLKERVSKGVHDIQVRFASSRMKVT